MIDFDLGILMGSTNEEIWSENTDKHPGARVMRTYYAKAGKKEGKSARAAMQGRFSRAPANKVQLMIDTMAPYEGRPIEEIEQAYAGFLLGEIISSPKSPSLGEILASLTASERPTA